MEPAPTADSGAGAQRTAGGRALTTTDRTEQQSTVSEQARPTTGGGFKQLRVEEFRITSEPYYLPLSDEVQLFHTAYEQHMPVLLKGPTGCGKTRFLEYMSWRLHQSAGQ